MNYAKAGAIFAILWLVQTTLLWRVWPFGAAPNILLCLAICFAWLYDANFGLVYAVCFGLLLDVQFQSLFGAEALAMAIALVPALLLREAFNPERVLPLVLAAFLAAPISALCLWGVYQMFGATASISLVINMLPELIVPQVIICTVLHMFLVRTIIKHRRDRRYIGGVA